MTHSIRTFILRADALTLGLFGLFGLTTDLLSSFAGKGAWKDVLFHNPLEIRLMIATRMLKILLRLDRA